MLAHLHHRLWPLADAGIDPSRNIRGATGGPPHRHEWDSAGLLGGLAAVNSIQLSVFSLQTGLAL